MILVVDDEVDVRRLVCSVLEQAGHVVIGASTAEQALSLLESHEPTPDLLLTDIVMPGMNGIMLAAQAHKRCPRLHVLFMSGYAQEYARELSGSVCISKPFKPAELIAAVQAALGATLKAGG